MNRLITLGLAGAFLLGVNAAVVAQDMDVDTGVETELGVDIDATGAIGADMQNYGAFVSGLQAGTGLNVDFDALEQASIIQCVTVTSLQGNTDNAMGLDSAISANEAQLAQFQAELGGNVGFMSQLEQSCPGVIGVTAQQVLGIQEGAEGHFVVYIDDRA